MFDPKSVWTTAVIASLVALGPLSTDMYLPAFPALVLAFGARMNQVQQTLSIFLVGFALAQLLYGPLSDRFGRKPMLLAGMLLFLLSSIGATLTQSIEQLSVLRLLQAIGGSAGPVLGRAMVRDIHGPAESARLLSYIGTAMAVAPAVAPIAGGYLTLWYGWESVFLFLAIYAAAGIGMLSLRVPETAPPGSHHPLNPKALLSGYRRLLKHPTWRWYTLCCAFSFSGLFSFLSGSAFVIINYYGYREEQFGLLFALVVIGYMCGTLIAGRLVRTQGIDRLLGSGAMIAAVSGAVMAILAVAEVHSVWAVIVPQTLYMLGTGIVMPQSMAGALVPFPRMAGTASALLGFVQMGLAALIGIVVGHYHDGGPLSMSLAIGIMGLMTLICYWLLRTSTPER
ncbi:MAG: multidrug effflux MFS transporter [Gammaproteobacteria bacterium]|nr:multidrug effflux MFS transporter [Gammaproteobacteria bacterium]